MCLYQSRRLARGGIVSADLSAVPTPDLERMRDAIDAELERRVLRVTSDSTREQLLQAARELERRAGLSESAKQES